MGGGGAWEIAKNVAWFGQVLPCLCVCVCVMLYYASFAAIKLQ